MRKLTGAVFQSLDGVMQAPGGPPEDPSGGFALGGWMPALADETTHEVVGTLFSPPYALLLGRRTYDIFASYWPYVTGEAAAMGQALTSVDKYVLTRGDTPLEWENSHRLGGIDAVASLKRTDGPDLLIQGSGTLYPALLAAGLLDRLVTLTFPLVLGRGKRLFGDGTPPGTLRLLDSRVSAKGAVIATYEPAGTVETGSFGEAPPNAREEERQRRIGEGSW